MEIVKKYSSYINFHWIAVVGTGMYTHMRPMCVIGSCCTEQNKYIPLDAYYASVLFIFAVLCLIAEYRLWPRSLKEPPPHLLYVYEMLIATLVANLAMRLIWSPLMRFLYCLTQRSNKLVFELNSVLGLDSDSLLIMFADYLGHDCAVTHMAFCVAVLSFTWVIDATESLDAFLDAWLYS